ncbi:protein-L-isoaspartate(D-aspartate) O-methyltransferase [Thioploca ingrica]|uniref:Protein-L-isoaspartate O-methyltransferase n=1 Tax=Thioploca ingrica TaxID=40754 RepID=A0A090AGY9_9GAMM|nr:protein-L-isoaspartate(D-aspartate) O-methyltransferase [Thioploca ingrica]
MSPFNFEQARFNMIEQQIRPWDVLDQRTLDLVASVPREQFVPEDYRKLAFADINIPLAQGQMMMSPKVEARLLQALRLNPNDSVLEIGTGSGYLTALLAKAVKHVDSVDIFPEFIQTAAVKLKALNINNVTLQVGDAINGWNTDVDYDVIVLTGSVPVLKSHFQNQLIEGGCLFAIIGEEPIMQAQLITRVNQTKTNRELLFETVLPPLLGAASPQRFIL